MINLWRLNSKQSINGYIKKIIVKGNINKLRGKGKSLKPKETRVKFNIGKSIKDRPKEVRKRKIIGHWELDKEFAGYNEIENRLNIDVYFADPYSSWQRGTNENTNDLLREFYAKKFNFATITQEELDIVVNIINNRPRKCLGYKTPAEVFAAT